MELPAVRCIGTTEVTTIAPAIIAVIPTHIIPTNNRRRLLAETVATELTRRREWRSRTNPS